MSRARATRVEEAYESLDEESGIRQRATGLSVPPPSEKLVSESIAAGGMASVHLLASGDHILALKRLLPHLADDDYFTKMLLDEAALASRIRHPNVVTTHGAEIIEGRLSVIMDYVPGLPLHMIMLQTEPGSMPVRFAVTIAAQALRGLHAAHEATDVNGQPLAIVHRDMSPQNIHVGTDGVTRVLDFGIAKATQRTQTTRAGDVKGKLSYMAPEQLLGQNADRRTDIRALAVVLWEALVGAPLFFGDSEGHTVAKIFDGRIVPPSELVAGVPPALDAIILRGLALSPVDRFATALEMARALESLLVAHPVSAGEISAWVRSLGSESLSEQAHVAVDLCRRSCPPPRLEPIVVRVSPAPVRKDPMRIALEALFMLVVVLSLAAVCGIAARNFASYFHKDVHAQD